MEKIYNPIQKDHVTFLKTHTDTNDECTLVEVETADGGGVGLHYHKTYSEKNLIAEGKVQVQLGKTIHTLQALVNLPQQNQISITCSGTGAVSHVNF